MNNIEYYISEYGKDIFSFCVYLTRNKDEAEDLYQQTFLVAIEKNDIDDGNNPKSYLITIAANIWNNKKRKRLWRKNKADIVLFNDDDLTNLQSDKESLEQLVERNDEIHHLRKAVYDLPDKMRIVVLMHYMENMSLEQISNSLDIPIGTVKSRLHHAKNEIRERMTYEGY